MSAVCDLFGDVVFAYTREQAITDGVLVDVSSVASNSGFQIPVAVTSTVWELYIEWTDEDSDKQTIQDESGRLADVLWMLYLACKKNKGESSIKYELYIIPRDGFSKKPVLVTLKSIISGGDAGEPVITIMLPNED